jgi:hypothetical protein
MVRLPDFKTAIINVVDLRHSWEGKNWSSKINGNS